MCRLCGEPSARGTRASQSLSRRAALKTLGSGAALALAPWANAQASAAPHTGGRADLILHNGHIRTNDHRRTVAGALAVRGDRITAVGHPGAIMRMRGPQTRMVNLQGRTVVPGLIDSHHHQLRAANDRLKVSLLDARSIADVVAAIGTRVQETPAGAWVLAASGWHESLLAESRLPTRQDLDPVSPDNPVYIPRGGHVATTNSRALEIAGITRDTPDPAGGVIVRDANGEPTGVLLERATDLLDPVLPDPPPKEEQRRLLQAQMADNNALGITGVTEPRLTPDDIDLYTGLWQDGLLTVRTSMLEEVETLDDVEAAVDTLQPHLGDDMLRLDGLKYLADGGVEGAFLREPYEIVPGEQTDPDYRGTLLLPPGGSAELEQMYLCAAQRGFQFQTHIVGDATMDVVVDVLAAVDRQVPLAPLRWALMHLFLPTEHGLAEMRRMGLLATVQDHPVLLGENQVEWWGRERGARGVPIREILDAGIPVGGGTDAPVAPPSPYLSMGWMVTRETLSGDVLGEQYGIGAQEALELYTSGSAYTQFAENVRGSIEPGKLADLVVLDADPVTVEPGSIKDLSADMTFLGGRVVHERAG